MDKDGKLKADEFILAMHLVDMAKIGQPLPLTLPNELIPPSQRYVYTPVKYELHRSNCLNHVDCLFGQCLLNIAGLQ